MVIKKYDVLIIGGGIIGAGIAKELSEKTKLSLGLAEANHVLAGETTAANSGVVHGGFDPTPGKLNAKLNILGKARYKDWFKEMDFAHKQIDSLVVAFNEEELEHIHMLYERGLINGVPTNELQILGKEEVRKREPNIAKDVQGALLCNSSVLIDPVVLTHQLIKKAEANNLIVHLDAEIIAIKKMDNKFILTTRSGEQFESKVIVNAAGHYADIMAELAGYPDYKLMTRRGEYRILDKSQHNIVNSIVFMVPTIHGKGVIVAPMLDGRLLVGPTSEDNVPKNKTRVITPNQYDNIGLIGRRLIPSISMSMSVEHIAGSRSIEPTTDDFWIKPANDDKAFINVAGTKSPGISSAPAIADMVVEMVQQALK